MAKFINKVGTIISTNREKRFNNREEPSVVFKNGTEYWYLNGKRHRIGGPAITTSGETKVWFVNGLKSREDGPAVERKDGRVEYWLKGIEYTREGWIELGRRL